MSVKLKRLVIGSLSFAVICMAVGFVALSMKLRQLQNKVNVFDVSFVEVKRISSVKGGQNDPKGNLKITSLGKAIDMDFGLFMEHDEMQYEIKIVNNGTMPASIVNLLMSTDNLDSSPIKVTLSDVSGKIIDPGEEITAKLNVIYEPVKKNTTGAVNTPSGVGAQLNTRAVEKKVSGKIGLLVESSTN